MKQPNYTLIDLSLAQFDFLNQKLKHYSFFFIGEQALEVTNLKNGDSEGLSQFFKENKIVSIGFIKKQQLPTVEKELEIIQQKIDFNKTHFAVLLQYENPHIYRTIFNLSAEESYLISPNEFVRFYEKNTSTGLCYHFMLKALDATNQLEQIIVHQLRHPNPLFYGTDQQLKNTEVIMPHQGDTDDLVAALWYLQKQEVVPTKVSVCFDENVTESHFKIVDEHSGVRFFTNLPPSVGPYPSRDVLARATEEEVIVFHDSDDLSTTNRISLLSKVLNDDRLDAVGSHELRVNKIKERIEAIRFPLDVINANSGQAHHPIFFPATAIKKTAYLKVGGLSTVRRHSSDSQFYKRAYFFLNLKNVDEFLYIRVKRENSLTTAKTTTLDSPVRKRLKSQWGMDFFKVQNRNISLNESTLIDEHTVAPIDLIPLKKEYREAILKRQELTSYLQSESPFKDLAQPSFPDEKDILEDRLMDYKLIKDPGVYVLKQSFSWRIGWAITRVIVLLFGWIPYVKKRI